MDLTPANKAQIDAHSYEHLLRVARFAELGYEWLQGETGDYWFARMAAMKAADPRMAHRISEEVVGYNGR